MTSHKKIRRGAILSCIDQALKFGFSHAGELDCSTLAFLPEVREMCASGKCGKYDRCWTCPPACGTVEECAQRAGRYRLGLIVQTTGQLSDSFDYDGMMSLKKRHQDTFLKFVQYLQESFPNLLALGAGGCAVCESCTYPDSPCRHPSKAVSSMEAYGLLVSELCKKNGIPYYYGQGSMTFIGCYLLA